MCRHDVQESHLTENLSRLHVHLFSLQLLAVADSAVSQWPLICGGGGGGSDKTQHTLMGAFSLSWYQQTVDVDNSRQQGLIKEFADFSALFVLKLITRESVCALKHQMLTVNWCIFKQASGLGHFWLLCGALEPPLSLLKKHRAISTEFIARSLQSPELFSTWSNTRRHRSALTSECNSGSVADVCVAAKTKLVLVLAAVHAFYYKTLI